MTIRKQYLITVDHNVSQLMNQPFCLNGEYDYPIPSTVFYPNQCGVQQGRLHSTNSETVSDNNHVHTIMGIHYDPETDKGGYYDLLANMINQGGPKTLLNITTWLIITNLSGKN